MDFYYMNNVFYWQQIGIAVANIIGVGNLRWVAI